MSQRSAPKYDHGRFDQSTTTAGVQQSSVYGNPASLTYSKYTPISSTTSTTSSSSKHTHRRSYGDSTIFPSESPFRNFNSPIASPPHKPSSSELKHRSLSSEVIKSPQREPTVRFSTPTRSYSQSPSESTRNYSKSGSPYGSYDYSVERTQYNEKQYRTEKESPLKSIKRFEFETMFRKNYKYIEKCLLMASDNDFQTFGVSTSSLPICLEMGTQLLYRVIEPSKITTSLIDNVLQLGAFQDPQQGILDTESILRMNDRFNKLLDMQASASISFSELPAFATKIDRVLETKRRSCLLLLQQNSLTKAIYSILDNEYGETIHVIFDPHSQKTNSTLHGASVLILIGNNVKKYLSDWLDFSPEADISYSIFFRRPEVEFFKFSFDKVKENSSANQPNSLSDLKKKMENERKMKLELMQRLEDQKKLISNLEMEIAKIESDYNEDSKQLMSTENTRRILTEVLHLLSNK